MASGVTTTTNELGNYASAVHGRPYVTSNAVATTKLLAPLGQISPLGVFSHTVLPATGTAIEPTQQDEVNYKFVNADSVVNIKNNDKLNITYHGP